MNRRDSFANSRDYLLVGQSWGDYTMKKQIELKSPKKKSRKTIKGILKLINQEEHKKKEYDIEELKHTILMLETENQRLTIENLDIKEDNSNLVKQNKDLNENIFLQQKHILRLNAEANKLKQNLHNITYKNKPLAKMKKYWLSCRQRQSSLRRIQTSNSPDAKKGLEDLIQLKILNSNEKLQKPL